MKNPTLAIAAIVAGLLAIASAIIAAAFLPDYLEDRREQNTPICIGNVSPSDAKKFGCRIAP
jgi:hypothetical protein